LHFVHKEIFKNGDLFVLVVNLVDILNNNFEDLEYWLCLLYHTCTKDIPIPLMVIGTHTDKIYEGETIKDKLSNEIKEIIKKKKLFFNFDVEKDVMVVTYSHFSKKSIQKISYEIERRYIFLRKNYFLKHSVCLKTLKMDCEKNNSPLVLIDKFLSENINYKKYNINKFLKHFNSYCELIFLGVGEDRSSPINNTALIDYHFVSSMIQQIKNIFSKMQVKTFLIIYFLIFLF
jgi:hypothetical protein